MLELKLLGSPQILLHGHAVAGLSAAKSQALLFYVALSGRAQSRLALAELLWPEKNEADALANLRQALYHLRNALPAYLEINRLTVALNPALPCQVDALLFETEIGESNTLAVRQRAVDRYTGEFLAGFYVDEAEPFEAWAVVIRERLHRLATEALQNLVTDFGARQEITLGLRYVNQWLALEPWHEEAHRQKMRLLASTGQPQAALAHYERCRQVLKEELGATPAAETVQLLEQIRTGRFDKVTSDKVTRSPPHLVTLSPCHDWGEAPAVGLFYGRQAELNQATEWLVTAQSRLVTVVGMGGMGKTALAAKVTRTIADHFPVVIWRSLLNAPPLAEIVGVWAQRLTRQEAGQAPTSLAAQLNQLFDLLREQRCLLILDNVESILQSAAHAGHYRPGYEGYGQLFQRFGASNHQSCLLLTSREQPPEVARLAQTHATVHTLPLTGLTAEAAGAMLTGNGVIGATAHTYQLIAHYSGNPLALMLVAETIQDLYAGDLATFLQEGAAIFGDIRDVLEQQWLRLTALEQDILLWLAIGREPIDLETLRTVQVSGSARAVLLEALRSLRRRSLIEQHGATFTLQNVVTEYITTHLINTTEEEVVGGDWQRFHSHALIQAQAKEYVRESQIRMILAPLAAALVQRLGRDVLAQRLYNGVTGQRQPTPPRPGYAAGNALNLLVHLDYDLRGYDFSHLCVWQAHLQQVRLPSVNFAHADLKGSLFAEPFRSQNTLTWSLDGALLAVAGADGVIRIWRTADRQLACICAGHEGSINALAFSPDSQLIASGSVDRTVGIWAISTQQLLTRLRGHTRAVQTLVWSHDGQWLISGGWDNTIRIWSLSGAEENSAVAVLSGHTDSVQGLTLSPDGTRLASVSFDRTLCVWDWASVLQRKAVNQAAIHTLDHNEKLMAAAWSPDGRLLVSGGIGQTVYIWDASSWQLLHTLPITAYNVRCLAFSPDNALLAVGNGTSVRLWAVDTWRLCSTLERRDHYITAIAWHPQSHQVATVAWEVIRLWDVATGQVVNSLSGYFDEVLSVSFSADGTLAASSHVDDIIRIWDTATWQVSVMLAGHKGWTRDVRFSPDGATLISAGVDQTVRLWDSHSGEQRRLLRGHDNWISSMTTSPDGQLIATGSHDRTVWLWETAHGQVRHVLHAHSEMIQGLAFSPDSQLLATGSGDATIRLWNTHSGQALRTLQGHADEIHTLVFDPTGSLLISGSADETIGVWDVHSGQRLRTLCGHTATVCELAMSPDGTFFASCGSADQTVRLWDLASGEPLQVLPHGVWVVSIAFSPDGQTLLTGCEDGYLWLWDVQTGQCRRVLRAPGPYEGMNITGVTGISEAQKAALKALGALEETPVAGLAASPTRSLAEQKAQETTTVQEITTAALSAAAPHNLPQPATPFVGRADDLVELAAKLANPTCRLLTISGPGGMGKTRLAMQAAQTILDFGFLILDSAKTQDNPKSKIQSLSWKDPKFSDGVFFVGLAGVGSPDLLVPTIAAALDFTFSGSGDPKAQLLAYLHAKSLLLVLDNFEHLLDGVEMVSDLLTTAPGVKILATSREPLNLREEWLHSLSGMSYPATGANGQVEAYTAIQLFTQCARQVQPGFDVASEAAAVARICRLVEGMPLGIELAATWLKFYSCGQIAEEITHDLDFLTTELRNVPTRHRSMRAIFEHSWRLLSPGEQHVLQRLALFRGGFTQAAAEQVAGASRAVLLALVERSLLQRTPAPRFQFHELMRQFAEEKLLTEAQAATEIKQRHALYYLRLLQEQEAHLKGRKQLSTTAILEADIENVRTAWQWGVANHQVDEIDRALESLHTFYSLKYWFQEGETVFGQAVATLKVAPLKIDEPVGKQGILIGKLLVRQGVMAVWFAWTAGEAGHWEKAAKLYQEALAILRQFDAQAETGLALSALGALHFHLGRFEEANPLFAQALDIFTAQDNRVEMGRILHELGVSLAAQGNYQEAIQTLQQGGELCEQSGDIRMRGEVLNSLAQVYMAIEEYAVAQKMMQAILSARTVAGDQRGMASSLALLGDLAWRMGDYATAQHYSQESLSLLQAIGLNKPKEVALNNLGNIACTLADYQQADEHFRTVLAINLATGKLYYDRYVAVALNGLATVLIHQGQRTQAAALLSLVIRHPATWQEMKNKATRLLAAFSAELPVGAMAAIQAHPQHQDLAAFIMPLLTQKVALKALGSSEETGELRQPGNTTIAPASAVSAPLLPPIALPAEVTGFVGREKEISQTEQRLVDPACRLLTITGMGGIGKTRLALHIAHLFASHLRNEQSPRFPAGIYFIPLAAVEPHPQLEHLLATTVANAVGIPLAGGDATPTQQLVQALAEKDLLLVLDQCEHLSVTAFINQLLQQTHAVTLLVTARTRLNVRGEQLIRLAGLTRPTATLPARLTNGDLARIQEHSAIRLFVQSVQAILPDFTLDATTVAPVTQVCQLLYGLPLGIELAATWARLLPLAEIVQEIQQNLDFLADSEPDASDQQRSLRAVFNHSWQRLTMDEQQALRRLTVFGGGFTREAAAQVAGATLPLLAQLTDKSLVQRSDPSAETMTNGATSAKVRYELQTVVRQYAAEQLSQAGETAEYQERHAAYMAQFLADQRSALQTGQQQAALRAIHAEIENVRLAWQWLLDHLQSAQSGLAQIADQVSQGFDSLFHFYDMRSWFQEGETVFGQLAQHLSAVIPPLSLPVAVSEANQALWRLQAKAQARQGWFAFHLGCYTKSRHLLTESLHRLQQLQAETDTIFNLNYLGALLRHLGEFAQATTYLQAALRLAQQHNDRMGTSIALNTLGQIALLQGDLSEARQFCQQALQIKRAIGDQWGVTFSLGYLGRVAQNSGDYEAAQKLFAESLAICQAIGDQRGTAFALQNLGDIAYAVDKLTEAQTHYQESLSIYRATGNRAESSLTLARLGKTYRSIDDYPQARQALREALALAWSLPSTPGLLAALLGLAMLALDNNQPEQALPALRFVVQHAASSQQQRQQAIRLLETEGGVLCDDSDWDLTSYVETILSEE